jgi:hypothetical protein
MNLGILCGIGRPYITGQDQRVFPRVSVIFLPHPDKDEPAFAIKRLRMLVAHPHLQVNTRGTRVSATPDCFPKQRLTYAASAKIRMHCYVQEVRFFGDIPADGVSKYFPGQPLRNERK